MHTFARIVTTYLIAQTFMSLAAWACSCAPVTDTPTELLDANDRVFVGEVISGPRGGCGMAQSSGAQVRFTLEVTEAFKGVEAGEDVVLSTARGGPSCGAGFEVGDSWLIYTSSDEYSLCSPGGLAEQQQDAIAELRGE